MFFQYRAKLLIPLIHFFLQEFCIVGDFEKLDERVCRDISDDNILALAKSSQPRYIITGDKDLLVLEKYNSIPIITPREFWDISKKIGKDKQ